MKNLWKKYLITAVMTVVLTLAAGCGNETENPNKDNQNTIQKEWDDGQNTSPNVDGAQKVPARDENGNIIEDLGEDVGQGIKDVGEGIGEGVEDLTGAGSQKNQ